MVIHPFCTRITLVRSRARGSIFCRVLSCHNIIHVMNDNNDDKLDGLISDSSLYYSLLTNKPYSVRLEFPRRHYDNIWRLPDLPDVKLHCQNCNLDLLHRGQHISFSHEKGEKDNPDSSNYRLSMFTCKQCEYKLFMSFDIICLEETEEREATRYVHKVLEYPSNPLVPKFVQKFLREKHFKMYRHAMIEEAAGRGIGAMAYYRRIVEDTWKDLLDAIIAIADPIADKDSIDTLEETKKNWRFENAVNNIKPALPKSLNFNGYNPLLLLHATLSKNLHASSDHECLSVAKSVRQVLESLLAKIFIIKNEASTLKHALENLQNFNQKKL